RLSGADLSRWSVEMLGRETIAPRHAQFGRFLDAAGSEIDRGIALYFPAPHSYTGEDVLELHGHGGPAVLAGIVRRCVELGARLAQPGEFTQRAFLNDKMDLAQAEAVADLIDAGSAAAARAAIRSLSGEFSREVNALVAALVRLRMFTEATLDFPDEEIDFIEAADARGQAASLRQRLEEILQRARQGQLLREGVQVVLIGQPNVGKSSLLNRLAHDDVAIVTPIAGTTRDAVRQQVEIAGVALHIIDTAGVRELEDADEVERLGIARAWTAAANADCALLVLDDALGMTASDEMILARLSSLPQLIVHNKIDLSAGRPRTELRQGVTHVWASAKTGEGAQLLESALLELAGWEATVPEQFLARERHVQALQAAQRHLSAAEPMLARSPPALELVAEELRLAQLELSGITGEFSSDDLLGEIFSRFCIGK
ncbi:MAG: tRNA uridine-5-carboxymethylaminomethyl(34) synthesis GTPase MnmE, partial [Betaproteobacteria bacterium]